MVGRYVFVHSDLDKIWDPRKLGGGKKETWSSGRDHERRWQNSGQLSR